MYYSQVTISRQISQRYRNTRRRSADVIRKPRIQLQLHPSTAASSSGCAAIEDDEENVQALQKSATIRSPAAQTVQTLLSATRKYRLTFFTVQKDLSILNHIILENFPICKESKWVCSPKTVIIIIIMSLMYFNYMQLRYEFKEVIATIMTLLMSWSATGHTLASCCFLKKNLTLILMICKQCRY